MLTSMVRIWCVLAAVLVGSAYALGQIVPSFVPRGIRKFSNGSNFTSMIIIDRSLYVGAKYV